MPSDAPSRRERLLLRVAATGCFMLATLALPWLALGVWAVLLIARALHGGEWAVVAVCGGVVMLGASLIGVGLSIVRVGVGRLLWHSDASVASKASRLGRTTLVLNLLALGAYVLVEVNSYREIQRLDPAPMLGVLVTLAALATVAAAHGWLLLRSATILGGSRWSSPG